MKNLGEKLKEQIAERERKEREDKAAIIAATDAKSLKDGKTVKEFCDRYKVFISEKISLNCKNLEFKVPQGEPFNTYNWKGDEYPTTEFKFSTHFAELVEWGRMNGLKITFPYRHDGMGLHGWRVVFASPI